MGDEVRVTVIAAGFDRWDDAARPRAGVAAPAAPVAATSSRSPTCSARDDDDDLDLDGGDDDFDVPSFLK